MITLVRLRAANFLALQDVDIELPSECTILVDGPNESGKSALFAAIVYGLYGRMPDDSAPEQAIRFGATCAEVGLTVDAAGTRLSIERSIDHDGSNTATLQVERQSGVEVYQGSEPVDRQIITLLAGLDATALVNSCYISDMQKGELDEDERQKMLLSLLNMDRLARLRTASQPTPEDETALKQARMKVELAGKQAAIASLDGRLAETRRNIVAANVRDRLSSLRVLQGRIDATQERQRELETRREGYEADLANTLRLDEAARRLDAADALRTRINERLAELRPLDEQIAELQRVKDTEIPATIDTLAELRNLHEQLARAEACDAEAAAAERERTNLQGLVDRRKITRERLETIQSAIAGLDTERARLEAMLAKLEKTARHDIPQVENARAELYRLERLIGEREQLLEEYAANESQLSASSVHLERIKIEESTLEALNARKQDALSATQAAQERWTQVQRLGKMVHQAEALRAWINSRAEAEAIEQVRHREKQAQEKFEEAQQQLQAAQGHLKKVQLKTVGLGVGMAAALFATILLMSHGPTALGLLFALCTCVLGSFTMKSAMRLTFFHEEVQTGATEVESTRGLIEGLQTQLEMAERRMNLAGGIAAVDERLRALEVPVPASRRDAQIRLEHMESRLSLINMPALQSAIKEPEPQLGRSTAELHRLDGEIAVHSRVLAEMNKEASLGAHQALEQVARDLTGGLEQAEQEIAAICERYSVQPDVEAVKQLVASIEERLGGYNWLVATRPQVEASMATLQKQYAERRQALSELEAALATHTDEELDEAIRTVQENGLNARRTAQESRHAATTLLSKWQLQGNSTAVREEAIRLTAKLESLQSKCSAIEGLQTQRSNLLESVERMREEIKVEEESARGLIASVGIAVAGLSEPDTETMRSIIANAQATRNEDTTRSYLHTVVGALGGVEQMLHSLIDDSHKLQQEIAAMVQSEFGDLQLESQSVEYTGEGEPAETPVFDLEQAMQTQQMQSLLHAVEEKPVATFSQEAERLNQERVALAERCKQIIQELMPATDENNGETLHALSLVPERETAEAEMERLEHEHALKERQQKILTLASKRMVERVLPDTERNARLLLPILTLGRYHDCKVEPDYTLKVWDPDAEQYIDAESLSAGAQVQLRLALRLGFALATLPEALATTPSFLLLDEPLGRSDAGRSAALVRLLTEGAVAQNFAQILVTAQPHGLETNAFTHRLMLNEGRVVFQNLSGQADSDTTAAADAA